jgi:polyisoprenoid-binding protein YceI
MRLALEGVRDVIKLILTVAAALAAASTAIAGERYTVDKDRSEVLFEVRHVTGPVGGAFTDFTGIIDLDNAEPARSSVEFRIKAASITTRNDKRDAHLRSDDFFDVAAYPEIVFTSTRIVPKGAGQFEVHGRLMMRGVTRSIVLPVSFVADPTDGGREAAFRIALTLNRKDYDIVWNRALDTGGWVLADEVQVSIRLQAARQVAERSQ